MKTGISHNGFSRTSIVREKVTSKGICQFCGSHTRLFQYGVQPDDSASGRVNWIKGFFCRISCMRSYH